MFVASTLNSKGMDQVLTMKKRDKRFFLKNVISWMHRSISPREACNSLRYFIAGLAANCTVDFMLRFLREWTNGKKLVKDRTTISREL